MAAVRPGDLFGLSFWVNYVVSVLITSWIPLARLKFIDGSGKVIRESMPPMYKIYLDAIQDPTLLSAYKYIGAHLAIVFLITALVWYLILRFLPKRDETQTADHDA